ncbi:2268_t:CDS:10 [Funneliformis mosseae]|uniref:2268_t:CDS:1 n=1 Tax=Funneliformis mosseae TaxID=27381 RepID=A0A9N8YJT0_FUNMO|nr:2268_t:CDS:10 [Funneliformis mosseae]
MINIIATYHSNPSLQKQAEERLKQVEGAPGFISILIQILGSEETEAGTKQAVSIYLKNRIRHSWNFEDAAAYKSTSIDQQDRDAFKANILHIMVTVPNNVRVQLLDSLNRVLVNDFPDKWLDYMTQIHALLGTNDAKMAYVGLLALQQIVKVYQWKVIENRAPLIEIIESTFPIALQMAQSLCNENSLDAAEMLRIILKTYSSATQYELAEPLQNNSSLVPWITLMLHIIEKPIPPEIIPEDLEERQKFMWYRVKRWSCQNLNRIFSRYGNPAQLGQSSRKYAAFAENFSQQFGSQILRVYLQQTELWIKKEVWLSQKVLLFFADFYKDALTHKLTWQIMKPYAETLVSHFIFPQLCFSKEDEELWVEDPVDYVHKKLDPLEEFTTPITSTITFLMDLAKYRHKFIFKKILNFIHNVLNTYRDAPPESKDPSQKDGALKMIGCISDLILRKKSGISQHMEPFFTTYVFPEFQSQYPYLRARACDMLVKFSDLNFENEANLATAFQGVTTCMRDTELPVKVQACLSLQCMIRHETVRNALIPNLPMIMQELLDLTNQIDADTLSSVMEEFVEVFSEELTPFAIQLTEQLRNTFLRIMHDYQESEAIPEDGKLLDSSDLDISDKAMAASGVLKTITTVLLSLESTPDLLAQLENALLPVITYTLENTITAFNISDLYDDIYDIIDTCTFSIKQISPTMWRVFELMYKTFKDTGIDYIEEMFPSLDNYLSYGTLTFIQSPTLQGMVCDIIETVMTSDRLTESERTCGCKLIESVLLNCRGVVDQYVGSFIELIFVYLSNINNISSSSFKFYCIEAVVNCIYYNPLLTLHILEERNLTQAFFSIWFENINKFSRVHDKKLVIVTLCSLMETPVEQLPPILQTGWPQVLEVILTTFSTLPKAEEIRNEMEKTFENDSEDDDDDDNEGESEQNKDNDGDDDDDVQDEDTEYLEFLAQEAARHARSEDKVDVYIRFHEVFVGVQQHYPTSYNLLTKNLDTEKQNFIMKIFSMADERKKNLENQTNEK